MDRPVFDTVDQEIRASRQKQFDAVSGPRVGDFLKVAEEQYLRFTYDWDDRIQTTDRPSANGNEGSFYLGEGYASYSGSLDPAIPKEELIVTDEVKDGRFWFFHHNYATAFNGVDVSLPCRVYRKKEVSC